ncbi:hypothetical protein HD554DRAFT_62135 [Boletus coccyginus]|nr:hypothetical protein HD554DRAFT_62135 [Boletus coccyginus]
MRRATKVAAGLCPGFKRGQLRCAPHHPFFAMPPKRSPSRTQQPAQRRPRTVRACNFCRIAKARCEPVEWGIIDRPCRRCVAQGLDCNLPRAARSQSPGLGLGVQGPGPIRHSVASCSAGGTTEELTPSSGTTVPYMLQQSEPARAPMARWSPFMDSSTTFHPPFPPAPTLLRTPSLLPAAPSMEGYQQTRISPKGLTIHSLVTTLRITTDRPRRLIPSL